ncbi:MAG: DUF1800 domain-containing protein [Bacteroidota bacterium]
MGVPNHKKIQHLYLRAGFGLPPLEWNEKREMPISLAVEALFSDINKVGELQQMDLSYFSLSPSEQNKKRSEYQGKSGKVLRQRNLDWINQMATGSSNPLVEKMTLFWHGHFANHIRFGFTAVQQINMLKRHALGNFKDLVLGICRDPGMLHYLNASNNQKNNVNENFGRELLELFTMGIGNYTQQDVVEASRAFTGWNHNEHFRFVKQDRFHDTGKKTFLGRTGNFDGSDIVDIILEEKATARFITRKIYAYFVNQDVNEARVRTLADSFYNSGYDIKALMKSILSSSWFYDEENIGIKIKSPTELLVGIMKTFRLKLHEPEKFYQLQKALGQKLFEPPNVSGWPSGKLWINNGNIMLRMGLANFLTQQLQVSVPFRKLHPVNISKTLPVQKISGMSFIGFNEIFGCCSPGDLVNGIAEYLLQPTTHQNIGYNPGFSEQEKMFHIILQIMRLPEYQVC